MSRYKGIYAYDDGEKLTRREFIVDFKNGKIFFMYLKNLLNWDFKMPPIPNDEKMKGLFLNQIYFTAICVMEMHINEAFNYKKIIKISMEEDKNGKINQK